MPLQVVTTFSQRSVFMKWNKHEQGWHSWFKPRLHSRYVIWGNHAQGGRPGETQTDTRRAFGGW